MAYASPAELASFLQLAQVDTDSAVLCLDLASTAIDAVAYSDTPARPSELKRVCLQVAARGYQNPEGVRVSGADQTTFGGESPGGLDLTREEQAAVRRAVHGRSGGFVSVTLE